MQRTLLSLRILLLLPHMCEWVTDCLFWYQLTRVHTHTHPFNGPFPGLPRWASTRKAKPIWILLKQETVSGSGISWAICKSTPRSRQITMPTPHHSVFYRPDALPVAQPTSSKHWRQPAYPGSPRQKVVKATKQLYVCVSVCFTELLKN